MAIRMTATEKKLDKFFGDIYSIPDYRAYKKNEAKAQKKAAKDKEKWIRKQSKDVLAWADRVIKALGDDFRNYTIENIERID